MYICIYIYHPCWKIDSSAPNSCRENRCRHPEGCIRRATFGEPRPSRRAPFPSGGLAEERRKAKYQPASVAADQTEGVDALLRSLVETPFAPVEPYALISHKVLITGFQKVDSPTKSSTFCLTIRLTILS